MGQILAAMKQKEVRTYMSTSKRHLLAILSNSKQLGELMVVKDVASQDNLGIGVGRVGDNSSEDDVIKGSHRERDGL